MYQGSSHFQQSLVKCTMKKENRGANVADQIFSNSKTNVNQICLFEIHKKRRKVGL